MIEKIALKQIMATNQKDVENYSVVKRLLNVGTEVKSLCSLFGLDSTGLDVGKEGGADA